MEMANRIDPVERLDWNERFREQAAQAICLRHPDAVWLAHVEPEELDAEHLIDTVMRLEAWIAEQPPLAIHPDSETARRERVERERQGG